MKVDFSFKLSIVEWFKYHGFENIFFYNTNIFLLEYMPGVHFRTKNYWRFEEGFR